MLELVESNPVNPENWPSVGMVSKDRSSIIGFDHEVFIYQGSNKHYDAYFDESKNQNGDKWAGITSTRHSSLTAKGIGVLSLFVPNKATCLSEMYPQPLAHGGSIAWKRLKWQTSKDDGVIFAFDGYSKTISHNRSFWCRTDSHWSKSGCFIVVNEILIKLGLQPLELCIENTRSTFFGDLASKWNLPAISEIRRDLFCPEIASNSPCLEFDNSVDVGQHSGRLTKWKNIFPKYAVNVTIVGDSFSGPGFNACELTWWLSRIFKSVTFIHFAEMPNDVVEETKCDVLIYQIAERFLEIPPTDQYTLAELLRVAASRTL